MPPSPPNEASASVSPERRGRVWLRAALLAVALLAAYANSFRGAFVFDDDGAIAGNPTLRRFATWFVPPANSGTTVAGRPLLNASFALNRAITGEAPAGFHAVNLAIHFAAACVLGAFVATALRAPRFRARWSALADDAGLAVALVWAVHPLLTESVTYIAQRAESLAGLWVLLALFAFARGAESARPGRWWAAGFAATLAGVATKEVAAVVPVLAWLYDGVFVAESWRAAWRRRGKVYALLALPWLPLALFVAHAGNRGGTAGVGLAIDSWSYLVTQTKALGLYLKLAVWPSPLQLDYGVPVWPLAQVWPFAVATLALFGATLWGVWRRSAAGFAGAWFFVLLAPSSSVVPVVTQTLAEHRMYLPLAALLAVVIVGVWERIGRRAWVAIALLTVLGAIGTFRRNADYASAEGMWRDVVAKDATNPRAWSGLATLLLDAGRAAESLPYFERGLALVPNNARYRLSYARGLAGAGRLNDAIREFEATLRLSPDFYEAQASYGNALVAAGRFADAIPRFEAGTTLKPKLPEAHFNLANALWWSGRAADALPRYERALALDPRAVDVRTNFAGALVAAGRLAEAKRLAQAVLADAPDTAPAHFVLAQAALAAGDPGAATAALRETLRCDPKHRDALWQLGQAELAAEHFTEAEKLFAALLAVEPTAAPVHNARGIALAQLGRMREARDAFAKAFELSPEFTDARDNLRRAESELRTQR